MAPADPRVPAADPRPGARHGAEARPPRDRAGVRASAGPLPANGQYTGAMTLPSPKVSAIVWGQVDVEGVGRFKDVKLYPGGAREWDWNETGTRHVPGIQPADVDELIAHGASAVVLSRGMWERLRVSRETLQALAEKGIEAEILQTEAAVKRFNELREALPVGGLFHSTC